MAGHKDKTTAGTKSSVVKNTAVPPPDPENPVRYSSRTGQIDEVQLHHVCPGVYGHSKKSQSSHGCCKTDIDCRGSKYVLLQVTAITIKTCLKKHIP